MLSFRHIQAGYRRGFSLQDVSFDMERGCITGIIGSNGSGKTTFLRALCHDIPFSGTMTMDGEDFSQAGLHRRSRLLALVPQQVEKIALSVFDYVLMGRTPYRKWYQTDYTAFDKQVAWEAIEEVGLTGIFPREVLLHRKMEMLSGGERQLAALAKALCQQTPVLLLDEPTANLDLAHQVQVLGKIAEISEKRGGYTLLVIHDINLAASYCDRLVCFSQGRVICEGKTEDVLVPEKMEAVYHIPLCIGRHPQSGKPLLLPRR